MAELFRRQPFVVAGGRLVLLIVEQLKQRGLLLRAALEYQQHAIHRQIGRRQGDVELGACQGMDISLEQNPPAIIHWLR